MHTESALSQPPGSDREERHSMNTRYKMSMLAVVASFPGVTSADFLGQDIAYESGRPPFPGPSGVVTVGPGPEAIVGSFDYWEMDISATSILLTFQPDFVAGAFGANNMFQRGITLTDVNGTIPDFLSATITTLSGEVRQQVMNGGPLGPQDFSGLSASGDTILIPFADVGEFGYEADPGTVLRVDITFVPAPGAVAVLGLGALVACCRRR